MRPNPNILLSCKLLPSALRVGPSKIGINRPYIYKDFVRTSQRTQSASIRKISPRYLCR